MNARIVLVPAIVALAALGMWMAQAAPVGVPAATWRLGVGTDTKPGINYNELPAESLFRLSFTCDEPRFVYVFSHSIEDGTLLLFPSPNVKSDLVQPVPAGHAALPGRRDDKELAWTTRTQISATTTLLVIAAREKVADIEALLPQLRRWTNTALMDGTMQVTNPASGTEVTTGQRTPLPLPLLQRAADVSLTEPLINGPLRLDQGADGVWIGSWRVKEQAKR